MESSEVKTTGQEVSTGEGDINQQELAQTSASGQGPESEPAPAPDFPPEAVEPPVPPEPIAAEVGSIGASDQPSPMPEPVPEPEPMPEPEPEPDPVQAPQEAEQPAAAEAAAEISDTELKAILEAVIFVSEEPLPLAQIAGALKQPVDRVKALLSQLIEEYARPERGLIIREVAGGFKMATKPEHHDAVRAFVKNLKPPLKLSLPALETLAVIAYKQPITAPEIAEIRGVQGTGVLKTLLDRKLITTAGRKQVIGKPILYKTTKEFLVQFGLKDLSELPTLKEFEELRRLAFVDTESDGPVAQADREAQQQTLSSEPDTEELTAGVEPADESAESSEAEAEASQDEQAEAQKAG
jgi:segregation and condensation protein B